MAESDQSKQTNGTAQNSGSTGDSAGSGHNPPEEIIAGAPPWMATFADMVTLLMCFFVLMFSMSTIQKETFKELAKSLQSALGVENVPEAGTTEGVKVKHKIPPQKKETPPAPEAVSAQKAVQHEVSEIVKDMREMVMFNQLGGQVKVDGDQTGATITISDVVLFPPGGARMSGQGLAIMKKITRVLAQFPYHITVAGHTDNIPIHNDRYASNWELSANRACEVVRYLIDRGLNPKKVSAAGYAEYHPIASNDTPQGRGKNRRVEIIYERRNIAKSLGVE